MKETDVKLGKKDVKSGKDSDSSTYTLRNGDKIKFYMGDGVAEDWQFDQGVGEHGVTFSTGVCPPWLAMTRSGSGSVTFVLNDSSGTYTGQQVNLTLNFKNRNGEKGCHDPVVKDGGTQ